MLLVVAVAVAVISFRLVAEGICLFTCGCDEEKELYVTVPVPSFDFKAFKLVVLVWAKEWLLLVVLGWSGIFTFHIVGKFPTFPGVAFCPVWKCGIFGNGAKSMLD